MLLFCSHDSDRDHGADAALSLSIEFACWTKANSNLEINFISKRLGVVVFRFVLRFTLHDSFYDVRFYFRF